MKPLRNVAVALLLLATVWALLASTGLAQFVPGPGGDICTWSITNQAQISPSGIGNLQIVAGVADQRIYVCDVTIVSRGTTEFQLVYGTGTNCGTGETDITPPYSWTAQTGWSWNYGGRMKTAVGTALCSENSAAVQVDVFVTYVQR